MKNTIGNSLCFTLFGESHGTAIGAVLDGMSAGVSVDTEFIKKRLSLRRPNGIGTTKRIEPDDFEILSGVFRGKTTGTPIAIAIKNTCTKSEDYDNISRLARPSHADYVAHIKYGGFEDYRGGGHFSGRLTAPIVALGAIALSALSNKGIKIGTHILSIGDIKDREFQNIDSDIAYLSDRYFGVLDQSAAERMQQKINEVATIGDSIGGTLQTVVTGMPAGVGEPFFDTAEGMLAKALFAIPAIKGVEFGAGFEVAKMCGSVANDAFSVKDGNVTTATNNAGGICGGITNGMPILFNCAVKPTPSIYKEQDSVNLSDNTAQKLVIKGRHDPCIVARARSVIESITALTIADMLITNYGTDFFRE